MRDMTKGAPLGHLFLYAVPLLLGNWLQLAYNAVDSIIAGRFIGQDALAAEGVAGPVMNLVILAISGLCIGAGVLMSEAFGAKRTARLKETLATTLLFGAALAVSILFCFLGMQAKYWTVKTLFELKFWSWLGLAIVVFVLVLRLVFKLQNKHAQHMVEKERAKAEKTREEAVKQAREEGRAEAMAAQQAQEAEAASAEPAAEASAPDAASDDAQNEMVGNAAEKES